MFENQVIAGGFRVFEVVIEFHLGIYLHYISALFSERHIPLILAIFLLKGKTLNEECLLEVA